MSDVVLIYPPYQGVVAGRSYSPLGLPYIASILERAGYSIRIVDSDMEGIDVEKVVSIVRTEKPKAVGITILTHTLPKVYQIINRIKSILDCEIIVGGPHITADPQMVADLNVRYGLRGESEYSFFRLFEHINGNTYSINEIDGLVLNENNELKIKKPCFIEDIDELSWPARHLIKTQGYKYNVVFSSRGCPYSCIYCAEQCRKVRYRNPHDVVDEIGEMTRIYGIRCVDFGDSVFTLNRDHVLNISSLLKERRLKVKWSCITRVDLVDMDLLKALKNGGCHFVSFGVESGVERIRSLGGKDIPDNKIRETFKQCRELGLKTRAAILFGSPTETVDDMRKSIEFVRGLKPDYALFGITQLFPGTPLFKQLLEGGYVDNNIWRDFMLGRRVSLDYLPNGVTFDDIYKINLEAFNKFYLDWGYVRRKLRGTSDLDEARELMFILLAKANVIPIKEAMDEDMHKCIE